MPKIPRTVEQLYAGYDPRREPLDVEILQEWTDKGIVYRYLRYTVGTFKGKPFGAAWQGPPPQLKVLRWVSAR